MNAATVKAMPPVAGSSTTCSNSVPSAVERNKQWQRELLMERIRSHASQQKTFPELSKAMRMSMLEKRYALDAVEKSNLQKCLDSMQYCIKVTSRQGLVERLESLSRQLGLKFMEDTSGLFISTDMFFLEIILDANGTLTDVKVHHECKIEQQSCSELVNCLNRGDFADFTTQLEGLSSIYQLNAEPKVKTKAFVALQAMETDLYNLFQIQNFSKDTQHILNKSTVGIVLKRRGGHPMKLTYFVSPYDLICLDTKSTQPLSIDLVTSKHIGLSVTVNLEASSANKLQVLPTVSFIKDAQTGVEKPVYAPLTQMNSTLLPATFVLRLNKPLPVCYATLRILSFGGVAGGSETGSSSASMELQHKSPAISNIMSLIVQTASDLLLNNLQKGLFVCLPDQTHCYFFTENKQLKATLVSAVPFTEPAQVPKILAFLKHQALFYTLLSSCVRSQSKMGNDMDSTTILEVNATSFQQISVSLQHPYEESMATIDFDLHNGTVICTIYNPSQNYDLVSLKLTKTVQRSLSIPVTIRVLLKFWDQERLQMFQRMGSGDNGLSGSVTGGGTVSGNGVPGGFGNFNLVMGPNDTGGRGGNCINGSVKLEQHLRQQMQTVVTSSGTSGTESIKFKSDFKKEDFLESPKSQIPAQSVEVNSLGHNQPKQHGSTSQNQGTAKASDIEIAGKYKNIWKSKTSNSKNCVSITPITSESTPVQKSMDVKQRNSGIEIIPLTAQNHGSGPNISGQTSTITITPINVSSTMKDKIALVTTSSSTTSNCKRLLDSGLAFDAQKEKKRKKKRDDSPMGPPEKVYSRQNSPAATIDAAATSAVTRKFTSPSSSPKGASGGLLTPVPGSSSLSTRPSPKHSPVYSSPKHNASSNSPKSPFGTQSPKHGSSGKPSMSTLKSAAATSLSPKGGDTKCASTTISNVTSTSMKNRDKDNASLLTSTTGLGATAGVAMPSVASTGGAVKSNTGVLATMQQLKSSAVLHHNSINDNLSGGFGGTASAGAMELNAAIRKGVTSAVSLMTSKAATTMLTTPPQHQQQQQQQPHGNSELDGSSNSQSSEYMVKSSQEGLKLTINKTCNKTSVIKIKTSAGTNSLDTVSLKKQHTGLKPGVNSGPASKKSATLPSLLDSSSIACNITTATAKFVSNISLPSSSSTSSISTALSFVKSSSQCTKHMFQKSNSSGSLTVKTTPFASGITSSLSKSNSSSSFTDLVATRKSNNNSFNKKSFEGERILTSSSASQPAARLDHHVDMMKILQYASPAMAANMEGFIKGLNSKFHIPKLSQRTSVSSATSTSPTALAKMQCSSAPSTPTNVLSPTAILGSTSPVFPTSNVSSTSTTISRTVDSTCGKQAQRIDNEGKMLQQQNHKLPRSPPPPYHVAITGGNATTASLPNATSTATLAQSSVCVHIVNSSITPVSPTVPVVGEREKKTEQAKQQSVEFLKHIVSDEALMETMGGE